MQWMVKQLHWCLTQERLMTAEALSHPLDRLPRADRRRWRRLDRQARSVLDAQQLRRLRGLARDQARVDAVSTVEAASPWVIVQELCIDGWRLVGRVPGRAAAALEAAAEAGPMWLAAAGRYGPYWTLTFGGRGAPLALLVNGLVVTRREGGLGGQVGWPELELLQ
jgi:hypothetical protein